MKVAIIIPRLALQGPVVVMRTLVNSLAENKDIEIKVFYLDKKIDPLIQMMAPTERLNRRHFRFSDYDIIHTNGIRPDLFAFLNRKKIRYHISTIHNLVFEELSFTYNRLISWFFGSLWLILWSRADKLVCVSNSMKEYYSRWFSGSKLEVAHNGIAELDAFSDFDKETINAIENFRSRGLRIIGSACILTKRKGIDQVLNFISYEPKFAFVIIGDGKELMKLKDHAESLGISDRCFFCGFRNSAAGYLRYFDFFIMPSRSEGFGLALVEAVQQKVPVICSDIDVFKELFNTDEVNFFKLDDIKSLSEVMDGAKESGDRKADLAFNRYLNEYTGKRMAERYLKLYLSAS